MCEIVIAFRLRMGGKATGWPDDQQAREAIQADLLLARLFKGIQGKIIGPGLWGIQFLFCEMNQIFPDPVKVLGSISQINNHSYSRIVLSMKVIVNLDLYQAYIIKFY